MLKNVEWSCKITSICSLIVHSKLCITSNPVENDWTDVPMGVPVDFHWIFICFSAELSSKFAKVSVKFWNDLLYMWIYCRCQVS